MNRKIVQIAVAIEPGEHPVTMALADDGSLWSGFLHYVANGEAYQWKWDRLPDLPSDNSNLTKVR